MPWCEDCSKYLTPTALNTDGSCPTCGRPVGEVEQRTEQVVAEPVVAEPVGEQLVADEATPWHFKLLIGAVVVYLTWRAIQMISWLF